MVIQELTYYIGYSIGIVLKSRSKKGFRNIVHYINNNRKTTRRYAKT